MPAITLAAFKSEIAKRGLESEFLKTTGLSSMDELSPENFDENFGKADTISKSILAPSAAPVDHPDRPKEDADAKPTPDKIAASDFLYGFKHMTIQYATRRKTNFFVPSSYMMFYIIHEMNVLLVEHFYFKRDAPNYHPLLLRVYFGILFIVQALRAQHAANALFDEDQYEFLDRFMDAYPPETLPIPSPLLHVFKSLCSSRPEIPQYGFVSPAIAEKLYGKQLKNGPLDVTPTKWWIPQIPAMLSYLATLATLKGKISDLASFLGDGTNDRQFAGLAYDKDPAQWTALQARLLQSAGMEHFPEGTSKFNEDFVSDRHPNLEVPAPSGNDNTATVAEFCYLKKNMSWFRDLVEIADSTCKFFPGSGSLVDCSPIGAPVCQIQVNVENENFPVQPTKFVRKSDYYTISSAKLTSSSRTMDQMSMVMAGASHINMRVKMTGFDASSRTTGPFWDLGPIESSIKDETALYGVRSTIKKMMLSRAK